MVCAKIRNPITRKAKKQVYNPVRQWAFGVIFSVLRRAAFSDKAKLQNQRFCDSSSLPGYRHGFMCSSARFCTKIRNPISRNGKKANL